jgi:hypothetical protein
MAILPNKDIMRKFGTFNKISKIYYSQNKDKTFKSIQEAKEYFYSKEALDSYKYCCDVEFCLTDDSRGLHWTINFGVPEDASIKSWADCWKDYKDELTKKDEWFKHHPIIEHHPKHLF